MKNWKKTAEVAIIGGGIMGVSTAYYLAKRGVSDVVILEKDLLAQASTGLSVGGIRQQFSNPANIRLSQGSVRVYERFEEEFGADIKFRQVGYIFLAQKQETWNDFLAGVETQRQHNVPVEVLSPEDIKQRWPYLNADDLKGGTFGPKDGYADPYLAAMGFADAARNLGVRIEEKTEVTGISIAGGRVQGVETAKGSISAPVVVNVAGPWGGEVAKIAGLDLPAKPYRRQVFMTKSFDAIPKPVPMIIDQDVTFYFRGEEPGIIMGMSDPDEPSSFNLNVDRNFLERVIEAAVHRAPVLEKAEILRGWGGLYTITPDDNPIIGEAPGVMGLFSAIGFSGHGFQQAPAVGRILSQLILDGQTDFDLKPFSYDRFEKREREGEKRVV
ncbi:MAG: FAD-dependent oxidoreductase [Candidatus Aminicenantes bacterium]|nr:FAD-dependent oxidoreductase [Candidatus Aminicenantes bacterium]